MDASQAFQNWVERHEAIIVELYKDYLEEAGDDKTSILEFSRQLYLETVHAVPGERQH